MITKEKKGKNGQVNYYNIASVALFIACYCDNVMLVMRCSLMSWDNGELAASKLIHRCSFHWFFPMGGGCCCWARLRVQNSIVFSFRPSGILCHFLSKQTRDVLTCVYYSIILSFIYKACTILRWSKVCLFSFISPNVDGLRAESDFMCFMRRRFPTYFLRRVK